MNPITNSLPGPELCRWIVWTLAHFLWQGALVAAMVGIADPLLRRWSPAARYRVFVSAMLLLASCPIATLLGTLDSNAPISVTAANSQGISTHVDAGPKAAPMAAIPPESYPPHSGAYVSVPAAEAPPIDSTQWILLGYLLGVLAMFARLLLALGSARRLRLAALPLDRSLAGRIEELSAKVGLRIVPQARYCARVAAPAVVGVVRPMILLPLWLTTDLTPAQVEAILIHELAHIRRYDHLVLLLQRIIEALLFFHPAVWFVSRRVSAERELCCDDAVISLGMSPNEYARGLLGVLQLARGTQRGLGLGAVGLRSRIYYRITRLLGRETAPQPRGGAALAIVLVVLVTVLLPPIAGYLHRARAATADPRILSVEKLAARVREVRGKVNDISVITADVVVKGGAAGLVTNQEQTILLKGGKAYLNNAYGDAQLHFNMTWAFDGRRTTQYNATLNQATIHGGRDETLNFKGVGFFALNLLCPPRGGDANPGDESLLSILAARGAKARDQVEILDRHPCEIVDVTDRGGSRIVSVWLDMDRGLLPVKQCWYSGEQVIMQFTVEQAMPFPGGLWLATRGHKQLMPTKGSFVSAQTDWVITVTPGLNGEMPVAVNGGIDDSVFDLVKHVPAGTRVFDVDANRPFIAGLEPVAQVQVSAPQNDGLPLLTPPAAAPASPQIQWEIPLAGWGETVEGLSLRIKFRPDLSSQLYLDARNTSAHVFKTRLNDIQLELDGTWNHQTGSRAGGSFDLDPGTTTNAIGPISFFLPWSDGEQTRVLRLDSRRHTVRLRLLAHRDSESGPMIAVTSPPLTLTIGSDGRMHLSATQSATNPASQSTSPAPARRVLTLVTEGNYFLERMVGSFRDIDLHRLTPAEFEHQGAPDRSAIIFDRYQPRRLPTAGHFLFFGAVPPDGILLPAGSQPRMASDQQFKTWDNDNPLLSDLKLQRVYINQAIDLSRHPGWNVLVDGTKSPLILQRTDAACGDWIVVAFELDQSNWPLEASYPYFMNRWATQLASNREAPAPSNGTNTVRPIELTAKDAERTITARPGDMLVVSLEERKGAEQWVLRRGTNAGYAVETESTTSTPTSKIREFRLKVTSAPGAGLIFDLRRTPLAPDPVYAADPTEAQIADEAQRQEDRLTAAAPKNVATGEIFDRDRLQRSIDLMRDALPDQMRKSAADKRRAYLATVERSVVFRFAPPLPGAQTTGNPATRPVSTRP